MTLGPALGPPRSSTGGTAVKGWVRRSLGLGDHVTILVAELACREPGCPPTETVISVMGDGEPRSAHVHKPVAEITEDDISAAFRAGAAEHDQKKGM